MSLRTSCHGACTALQAILLRRHPTLDAAKRRCETLGNETDGVLGEAAVLPWAALRALLAAVTPSLHVRMSCIDQRGLERASW